MLRKRNVFVCVLQREADAQAGPDGRLSGLSQHWTLALGAHETFTSTRNISQVEHTSRYTLAVKRILFLHGLLRPYLIFNI